MKLIAMMPCRNEEWCVEFAIHHALKWCDEVIVLVHASTDRSNEIVTRQAKLSAGKVVALRNDRPEWNEADDREILLQVARRRGATHVAMVDCDEALTPTLFPIIRPMVERMYPGELMVAPWFQCWRSMKQYRCDDSRFGVATVPLIFADTKEICFKASPEGMQLHRRVPLHTRGIVTPIQRADGGVLHFQHVNWTRLLAKQALYKMQERVRYGKDALWIESRYNPTVSEAGLQLRDLPREWIPEGYSKIDVNAAPWQINECRRLLDLHGPEKFKDLNLFGVV